MITLTSNEKRNIRHTKRYKNSTNKKKLCILSHFDVDQRIDNYVIYMIKQLYKLKFDIVFVTTSEQIQLNEFSKIKKYLMTEIVKKNVGYDFISWKTGLSSVEDYKRYEMILHINDSIFFPLVDPREMFDTMMVKNLDCWGLTDSFKQIYHIESFFWVVNQKLLKNKVYENFWNNCKILNDKSEIIQKYEMGFAPYFMKHGFKCLAYISLQAILQKSNLTYSKNSVENLEQKRSFNFFWDIIIKDFKAPFIKKKILIKSHPEYNPTTFSYKKILQQYTSYDVSLIEQFLQKQESTNQCNIEQKKHDFFLNVKALAVVLRTLQKENNLVLYGFGEVGYLIYSNLENNIIKIIDRSYISLEHRYKNIKKFCSIKKIKASEKIIIAALGRENSMIETLKDGEMNTNNVVLVSHLLPFDALKFANNITKLLYNLDALYKYSIEEEVELYFCSTNIDLNAIMYSYFKLHAIICHVSLLQKEYNDIMYFQLSSPLKNEKTKIEFLFV